MTGQNVLHVNRYTIRNPWTTTRDYTAVFLLHSLAVYSRFPPVSGHFEGLFH